MSGVGAGSLDEGSKALAERREALERAVRNDEILLSTAKALLRLAAASSGMPAGVPIVEIAIKAVEVAKDQWSSH